eukprot:3158720-Pyramimonas_sp.AAC.1
MGDGAAAARAPSSSRSCRSAELRPWGVIGGAGLPLMRPPWIRTAVGHSSALSRAMQGRRGVT